MITWLFFDLGSTLIDESDCIEFRISELLRQDNAPEREALEKRMFEIAAQNGLPYKQAAEEYHLETSKWRKDLEKLYDGVPQLLKQLSGKYKLGIIANQSLGTEQRLISFGIRDYFDVIIASAEAGVSKPDPEIFRLAMCQAGCTPDNCCMIGDRLDNDIEPAAAFGMKTIWVRQGPNAPGNVDLIANKPDVTVECISQITEYL